MFESFPDGQEYKVVINHEEQYSLWPVGRANPQGWREVGRQGSKKACLTFIEEVWTDMRPLKVHDEMASRITRLR